MCGTMSAPDHMAHTMLESDQHVHNHQLLKPCTIQLLSTCGL